MVPHSNTNMTRLQDEENVSRIELPAISVAEFCLDANVLHLSHGSFGGTPRVVHAARIKELEWLETSPDARFMFEVRPKLRAARSEVGKRFGAATENLLLQTSATVGLQTVLKELDLGAGDEIICTNHNYVTVLACIGFLKNHRSLEVTHLDLPDSDEDMMNAFASTFAKKPKKNAARRLLVVDHISSPGARFFDVKTIAERAHSFGLEVLVDGAHAPGMIDIDIEKIGADFYVGNLHKWACCARGTAFLWVHPMHHNRVNPLLFTLASENLWERFEWPGTSDLSPLLALPESLKFFDLMVEKQIPQRNIALAKAVTLFWNTQTGADALYTPNSNLAMVALKVPCEIEAPIQELLLQALRHTALTDFAMELPFTTIDRRSLLVRPSCHAYNALSDYKNLPYVVKKTIEKTVPGAKIHFS